MAIIFVTKGKTNWKYILIILILSVFVGGGILWWAKTQEVSLIQLPEIKKPEKPPQDETAKLVPSEVEGWETYRNEEYGFVVECPNDWIVKKDVLANEINFGEEKEIDIETIEGKYEKMKLFKVGFTVRFYQDKSKLWGNEKDILSLEEWITKYFLQSGDYARPLDKGESIKNVTFGAENYKGIRVERYKPVGVIKIVPRIFVQRNSVIYEIRGEVPTISTSGFPTEYDYDKVFNQMLSTFRFLE